jgi:TPR repeat protein
VDSSAQSGNSEKRPWSGSCCGTSDYAGSIAYRAYSAVEEFLYESALDQSDPVTQVNYAFCLEHGNGVPVDLCRAASYYKLAADQHYADGQYH